MNITGWGIFYTDDCWQNEVTKILRILPLDKEETFEGKLERMKMDKFKKDYPMFSNLDKVIESIKTNIKVHSNEYMNN